MKTNKIIIIFLALLTIHSCDTNNPLGYENNKEKYKEAVNCLLSNYILIFPPDEKRNPVEVYNSEHITNFFCKNYFEVIGAKQVSIVTCYNDSTIFFYSLPSNGVKSKQIILVFTNDFKKLNEKITSDIKIKSRKDKNWYEMEKIISVAN
jgi:hypothetical protein